MLPLSLLRGAVSRPLMVELKSGETINGTLTACDTWMNLTLAQVVLTSADGQGFTRMESCYVRGNTVKLRAFTHLVQFFFCFCFVASLLHQQN
jgi:U6 snRNA-associated Sm-like protein LSm4